MKTSSKIMLALAVLLVVAGGFLFAVQGEKPTPDALIRQSLSEAENAARRGSAGGVMDSVSDDFKSGPWDKTKLRLLLARSLKAGKGTDYNVRVNAPRIMPSPKGKPDERLVTTQFSAFYSDNGENIFGTGPVVMVMRQETERKWLFFREPKWRIVSIVNAPPILGSDPNDAGGGLL